MDQNTFNGSPGVLGTQKTATPVANAVGSAGVGGNFPTSPNPVNPTGPGGLTQGQTVTDTSTGAYGASAPNPANINPYGYDVGSGSYASDTMAAIARQDYQQYQQYFQPLEGVLAGMVNNNQYNNTQVSTALGNFNNQTQASAGTYQRDLSRYGLSMNAQQTQSYNRLTNESNALGKVNAVNTTNRAIGDNEMSILFGAGGTPSTSILQNLPANALGA